MNRKTGIVKFWKHSWGIIACDDGSADHFIHWKHIETDMGNYAYLHQGQAVSFHSTKTERGLAARELRVEAEAEMIQHGY